MTVRVPRQQQQHCSGFVCCVDRVSEPGSLGVFLFRSRLCSWFWAFALILWMPIAAPADSKIPNYVSCSDKLCRMELYCDSAWWGCSSAKCLFDKDKKSVFSKLDLLPWFLKGHEGVIRRVRNLIAWRIDHPDEPLNLHFAGDNGVGKTTLAKLISLVLSNKRSKDWSDAGDVFFQIDSSVAMLPETATKQQIELATDIIANQTRDALIKCPNAVILVDELDLLHPAVLSPLKDALKGLPVKGRPTTQATFILTSDFGKEGQSLGKTMEEIEREVPYYSAGMYSNPEMKDRVALFPFLPFDRQQFEEVVASKFQKLHCAIPVVRCVEWDDAAQNLVIESAWTGLRVRNGREIDDRFQTLIEAPVAARLSRETRPHSYDVVISGPKSSSSRKLTLSFRSLSGHNSEL